MSQINKNVTMNNEIDFRTMTDVKLVDVDDKVSLYNTTEFIKNYSNKSECRGLVYV